MDSGFDERGVVVEGAHAAGLARLRAVRVPRAALAPALAISGVALALATQFSIVRHADVPYAGVGFVAAIGLFGAAALVVNRGEAASRPVAFELPRRWEIVLLVAVIGLAAFFRFFRFMQFPPGLWYDEAVNGTDALSIIDRAHLTVWRSSNFGHSTLFFYLLIASFKAFGYTLFAMRLVPAVAGLAAVVAFYFLARWLLGAVPALVATALFAVSRYAVTFSRISWEASLQPLLEIMAVYFFVRALETRSKVLFALAGGSLAAGIYTYLAFRFVPVVMLFFLLYVAATQWSLIRRNIPGLVIYGVSFLVVIAPLGQFAIRHQDLFLARTKEINVFKEIDQKDSYQPLRSNIEATIKMMNVAGDKNGRHNISGAPMLDGVSAALLVLGMAVSVWSIRNWRKGSMAGWLALAVIPGALTISLENPSAIRTIGALPPLFMLIGLAVGALYRSLAPTRNGLLLFGAMAGALVISSAAINYYDFFERQAHDEFVADAFTPAYTWVGQTVAEHAGDESVYVSGEFVGHPAVQVLGRGKHYSSYHPSSDFIFPVDDRDVLLILDVRQFSLIPTLRRLYPDLVQEDYVDQFGRVPFTRITLPASDVNALHELKLTLRDGKDAAGPALPPTTGTVNRDWSQADLVVSGAVTAVWEGYTWITSYPNQTQLTLTVPGSGTVEIDGAVVGSGTQTVVAAAQRLAPGEHRVRIVATITRPGQTLLTYQGENGAQTGAGADNLLYGRSAGAQGFQVVYHAGSDFSGAAVVVAQMPFAYGAEPLSGSRAIEYRAEINVPAAGDYGFALDGGTSAQLFVDDTLAVDNGGSHGARRIEGAVRLAAGQHLLSVQYVVGMRPDWALSMRPPDGAWTQLDGSEVRPPPGPYVQPAVVALAQDAVWGGGHRYDGLAAPEAITMLPDGTAVAASGDTLVFIDSSGSATRTVKLGGGAVVGDLATDAAGQIVALDRAGKALLVIGTDGEVRKRITGPFPSASGVAVAGETAYLTSPSGGRVYAVPLGGGDPTLLPVSAGDAPVRAAQPSDVAIGADGTLYLIDFEKHTIVISPDGKSGRVAPGAGGVSVQTPRAAMYGNILLVTDPLNERILMYDAKGKQRGVYVFPPKFGGTHPIGIAASPGGSVYVADVTGFIYRLKIDVPAELANQ